MADSGDLQAIRSKDENLSTACHRPIGTCKRGMGIKFCQEQTLTRYRDSGPGYEISQGSLNSGLTKPELRSRIDVFYQDSQAV